MATIIGGSEDDFIQGTDSKDTISAGGGNNTVDARAGNDVVTSGSGNDSINGGTGNDTLTADGGDDTIDGGTGGDRILGSTGNDLIIGGSGGDLIDGGSGTDTASYGSSLAAVNVNLSRASGTGGDAAGDTVAGIENLIGSNFNDTLIGNSVGNVINGGGGNDTITGGLGNDTMDGGAGTDRFVWTSNSFSGDVAANTVETVQNGAGDQLDFSPQIEGLLTTDGTALSALAINTGIGNMFEADTNVRFSGNQLQFDVNGDQSFSALQDFAVNLAGVNTVTYDATNDWFVLLA